MVGLIVLGVVVFGAACAYAGYKYGQKAVNTAIAIKKDI